MRHSTLNRVVLVALLAGLAACAGTGATDDPGVAAKQLSDALQLNSTKVTIGQPIQGSLVVSNPGGPINLSHGCRPGYVVILANSSFPPQVFWPTDCEAGPFLIAHGRTSLPFTVETTYSACAQQGGSVTSRTPPCVGDEPPPLPPGTYEAVIEWESSVPLPPPHPVPVTLLAR